jgi:hypothetical protein
MPPFRCPKKYGNARKKIEKNVRDRPDKMPPFRGPKSMERCAEKNIEKNVRDRPDKMPPFRCPKKYRHN